jgi:hypothetical protein
MIVKPTLKYERMFATMKARYALQILLLGLAVALGAPVLAFAQQAAEPESNASRNLDVKAAAAYKPAETTIAVLFAPNNSDDKWKEQKEKESQTARDTVYKLFTERGFQPIAADRADTAVSKAGIDLQKEDQWTKANFYKVGKEVGANLVAFVLIKQTRQKEVRNLFSNQYVGEAEIEVWLVDASQDTPIVSDEPARGRANGGARGASHRRCSAVEIAVKSGFAKFLKPYPSVADKTKK